MEPQIQNQDKVSSMMKVEETCAWYSPLCRTSTFSRLAIALIVIVLPFVGGYVGYQINVEQSLKIPNDQQTEASGKIKSDHTSGNGAQSVAEANIAGEIVSVLLETLSSSTHTWSYERPLSALTGLETSTSSKDVELSKKCNKGEECKGFILSNDWEIVDFSVSSSKCIGSELRHRSDSEKIFDLGCVAVVPPSTITPQTVILMDTYEIVSLDLVTGARKTLYEIKEDLRDRPKGERLHSSRLSPAGDERFLLAQRTKDGTFLTFKVYQISEQEVVYGGGFYQIDEAVVPQLRTIQLPD